MVADKAAFTDGAVYIPVEQYLALDDTTDGLYEYWHSLHFPFDAVYRRIRLT